MLCRVQPCALRRKAGFECDHLNHWDILHGSVGHSSSDLGSPCRRMGRNECCTGLTQGRYWILGTGVLGHCINDDPISFAFFGMAVWGETVLYLVGHAKHRLHENFLVGASGFRKLFEPVLRHETTVDQHRCTIRTNKRGDNMVACGCHLVCIA